MAFIKGKDASSVDQVSHSTSSAEKVGPEEITNPAPLKAIPEVLTNPIPISIKAANIEQPAETIESNTDTYLVAITTRLKSKTADALRRAHLEQKLHRHKPDTQQDIIEAAVQHWLIQHAFLDE